MSRRAAAVARPLLITALVLVPFAVFARQEPEEKVPTEEEAAAICARVAHFKPGPEATASAQDRKVFADKRAAAASPEAFKQTDAALNAVYKAAMAQEDEICEMCGGDERSSRTVLRDAQRAWIHYRDAWTAFYRLRWKGAAPPEALDREITTALTGQRAEELRKLGEEQP